MKTLIFSMIITLSPIAAISQINWGKVKKEANKAAKNTEGTAKDTYDAGKDLYDEHFGTKKTTNLTNTEVINGLKEALEVGTNNSASKASQANGFLYNSKIKIPWPEDAEKAKNTLINIGMKTQVDKVVKTMNRAAEEASKEAAPIFVDAIKQMSIGDGFKILKGANNEATKYLSDKTSAPLKAKFRPIVKEAIKKVKLTQYWNPCVNAYNKIPGVEKMNPDLDDYITQKAMDGLFKLIAEEELKIRKDPIARVSDLLKKVFGSLDK